MNNAVKRDSSAGDIPPHAARRSSVLL
jgi:hypothetical protein